MSEDLLIRVSSVEALWAAARRAARGKRGRAIVASTLLNLEGTVLRLQRDLRDGTWTPGKPTQHEVFDPKRRMITAAPFEDRIVHQALCAEIGPLLERHLIGRTYACRVGLGTHAALRQARLWAGAYRFVLHMDVTKYFPSIDHGILIRQLERAVHSPAVLELCVRILDAGLPFASGTRWHFPGDDLLAPISRKTGLPIGNLTSQHFANRYLSPVDHRATDRLRVHAYLRYMDDMLLFSNDRVQLSDWGHAVEEACWRNRLRLHTWQVVPVRQGFTWLGFRILPGQVRVKRTSVNRARKRLQRLLAEASASPEAWECFMASLRSTFAHWEHADSWRLREKTLRELGLLHDEEEE
jgi:hypothetical protein